MISRAQRLSAADFPSKSSKGVSGRLFLVISRKRSQEKDKNNRFAVVVGKGFDPRSTKRHALKRLVLKEITGWPPLGTDFLVITRKTTSPWKKKDILEDLSIIKSRLLGRNH